ncbi:MAG TPA: HD domain-containing phosphohydrolase [Armatimonadota bacterium]
MSTPLRVLLINSSDDDAKGLVDVLLHGGYCPDWKQVDCPAATLEALTGQAWDVALVAMPEAALFNGLAAIALLKELAPDLPSIMIIDLEDEEHGVSAMQAGARDYICRGNWRRLLPSIAREIHETQVRRDFQATKDELAERNVEVGQVLEQTVNAIAAVVERRDSSIVGHSRRVSQLACAIAGVLELPQEQIAGIRTIGMLHDIGKISVPDDILWKPGKLTELEMALVKTHPQAGYSLLRTIPFPRPVAQTVLQHHERLNGTGYPNGLAGNDILLEARIIAVADVVDAISSHRPYRQALSSEDILQEIIPQRNMLYDGDVVDACLAACHNDRTLLPSLDLHYELTLIADKRSL